ncbi:MAG: NAD+ synthase [candidate division WOR-3 bacterium]|nr:NAD+ synthase [candidate division WOR-3 bacterium]
MWKDIVQQIVDWLKGQLEESGTQGFVLGLSGGLDSSVCAALVRKTTNNCLGLILPIESDVKDLDDAADVADVLNTKTQYIDLTTVYSNLLKLMPDGDRLALGNLKARLRMIVLYYHANLHNYLVCGTGNKTEISLGYFTKYGDGACDILPIGDLYKGEVRELARELNIPESIIKKIPSAGLWSGQTDEKEIGFTYEEMDNALRKIEGGKIDDETASKLHEVITKTAHKKEKPKIFHLRR